MLFKARQLFVRVLAPLLLYLPLSGAALAEEKSGWTDVLNMTPGVTEVSRQIYGLHMIVLWISVVIGIVVFGIMFYSMIAHRKSRGHKAANFHESTRVEIAWTVIPALILIIVAIPATRTTILLYDTSESEIDIKVTGYQWRWQYEYLGEGVSFMSDMATPDSQIYGSDPKGVAYLAEVTEPVVIPVDTKVRFLLTSNDVIHAWWVTDFGVKKDAIPGYINETWAKVEKTGVYRGYCAELCGRGHAFMPIEVHVVEQDEYQDWIAEKRDQAEALRELTQQEFTRADLMERGKQIYDRTCASCHMADGSGVRGVFPAITNSPLVTGPLAANMDVVINGVAGTAMQAFGDQLSEVDLAAVLTYQRNALGNDTGDIVQPVEVFEFKQGQ